MAFEDNLKEAMTAMLVRYGVDAEQVTDYEQYTYSDGICETCYYETERVRIRYLNSEGEVRAYQYYGDFGELIRELT